MSPLQSDLSRSQKLIIELTLACSPPSLVRRHTGLQQLPGEDEERGWCRAEVVLLFITWYQQF